MAENTAGPNVRWDYTEHAAHYDKRADYSALAIENLLRAIGCGPSALVADIGAGTGKLTKELLKHGLAVRSVEPNDAMRTIGIQNTNGRSATWSIGTGEATGLPHSSAYAVFFGSSFNVVNQELALAEVCRILVPNGWFACMWNHRDLEDPIQRGIESIIKFSIPNYSYGSRREDPTDIIKKNRHFSPAREIAETFVCNMSKSDVMVAWKSHATLRREAGDDDAFDHVIDRIGNYLAPLPEVIAVPYTTRIYFAQKIC